MVIGEDAKSNDLEVNVIKRKKFTNMRSSGADDAAKLAPKIVHSLEEAMECIRDDAGEFEDTEDIGGRGIIMTIEIKLKRSRSERLP